VSSKNLCSPTRLMIILATTRIQNVFGNLRRHFTHPGRILVVNNLKFPAERCEMLEEEYLL
jgi:hypothetical protein